MGWDVSRVTNMRWMFRFATLFNQDVSKWDVSSVTNMDMMFFHTRSFNQTLCSKAWVNSKASKFSMFEESPGSISTIVCAGFSPHTRNDLKKAVDSCVDSSQ